MRRVPVPNLIHLPFVENAWIPEHKLRQYVLNPEHPDGGAKARFFRDHLGIGTDDWEYLHDQIMEKLPKARVATFAAKQWRDDSGSLHFGVEFEVRLPIDGLNGQRCEVVTGWMVGGALTPSFTTAYPSG